MLSVVLVITVLLQFHFTFTCTAESTSPWATVLVVVYKQRTLGGAMPHLSSGLTDYNTDQTEVTS